MGLIDKLTDGKVYEDPVNKIQEEMLLELYKMREQVAQAVGKACEIAAAGGDGGSQMVSKADYDEVVADNTKLKYRVKILTNALDEIDGGYGGSGAAAGGASIKLYTKALGFDNDTTIVQIVCRFLGCNIEWIEVTDEILKDKAINMKTMNPAGMFPMIEVSKGVGICGAIAICKHLSRQAKKFVGNDLLQGAQVDQWVNWTYTTLMPTADQVMSGIFGTAKMYSSEWKESEKELKQQVKLVNNALKGDYLVGNQMTLADIFVSVALAMPFQTVLDAGFRKGH